jgi:hypothetical protein
MSKPAAGRFRNVLDRTKQIQADLESQPPEQPAPPEVAPAPKPKTRGKKEDKANYTQVTVYLRKQTHSTARKLLFDERRQFSDLVEELVTKWISDVQKSGRAD